MISIVKQQTGSQLAELASSMIYFMWHARTSVPLGYTASPAFRKFCYQVLVATKMRESVIYLSLKYIAILLKSNPSIEGAEGSEYRLFIVALMLANKFLDDNTYSNKAWSIVSGMKVSDLFVMEAEFLEALDYNLFVHEQDFNVWKRLLEESHNRISFYYYSNPQQVIIYTLKTLGLYHDSAIQYQIENAYKRYQHFMYHPQQYKSWDPLTYQIHPSSFYQQNSYYQHSIVSIQRELRYKSFI